MLQEPTECFRLLLEHNAWIEHEFLSGIRNSRKAGSLWGMMRGVVGVRKSIHQGWLARGLGLRLLCLSFKGVQREITSEGTSTLQIGSVAFSPGGSDEGHWHAHTRGFPWGLPEVVGTVQQVHCSRRRFLWTGLEFHLCTIYKSAHTKKLGNLFNPICQPLRSCGIWHKVNL